MPWPCPLPGFGLPEPIADKDICIVLRISLKKSANLLAEAIVYC